MKTIGETLRKIREQKGMLLREVGAAIGIDPTILSKIECGARKPSKVQLYALAEFYNEQKNEIIIAWLSDNIAYQVENEELAVQAIQVAEQKVFYKNESKIQANKIIDSLQSFFKKDGRVSKVWLFGSYARNEANQHSDIDLLVRFNKDMRISLFDLADISYLLEQILHIKVDLVEEGYPASFAAESIENEKLLVYEKE
ncbi:MAG: helix-turn-helix domain-containing protein [Bacteroidetes bacterium]|nr:helix-turn-helix domain-containing protein [Bacteroidota bacterium]MBT5529047.1 helix-turn-helix domain-containing protein [Cytophagia bacterium]MBT3421258.1 helix-turn-helix domain-containing protein [Bacteroidota bacterium]MBT3802756.1 helix-turn-helix domain-containing protein [Bacteroidota bacterium]MBT3935626.1 helix-turn-helix domain-containing protein [Bacteroidota bacterium]